MKIKKNLLFLLAIFAVFGFAAPVYADSNGYITTRTTIKRWSPTNDLVFNNGSCSSAYLTDGTTTVNLSCNGDDQRLGFVFDDDTESWNNYQFKFTTGKDVTLVETYYYSDGCGETLCSKAKIGTINAESSLSLNFNVTGDSSESRNTDSLESEIQSKTFTNYTSSEYTVYLDKVYSDGPGGDTTSYYYLDSNGKTDDLDLGSVLLPIYFVKYDFSASGNMMPYGSWSVEYNTSDKPYDLSNVSFDMGSLSVSSGTSTSGTLLSRGSNSNGYYSRLRFKDFYNIGHCEDYSSNAYFDVSYSGSVSYKEGTEVRSSSYSGIGYSSSTSNYQSLSSANRNVQASRRAYRPNETARTQKTETSDDNTYYYTLNRSVYSDISVPNGLFYNMIPFIVIIAVAATGIVIIKKKLVKA